MVALVNEADQVPLAVVPETSDAVLNAPFPGGPPPVANDSLTALLPTFVRCASAVKDFGLDVDV